MTEMRNHTGDPVMLNSVNMCAIFESALRNLSFLKENISFFPLEM